MDGLVERYSRNGLLNRVINDRGRLVGSLIALYLYFSPVPGSEGSGLTAGLFQEFCVDLKLCSPGQRGERIKGVGAVTPAPCGVMRRGRSLGGVHHQRQPGTQQEPPGIMNNAGAYFRA